MYGPIGFYVTCDDAVCPEHDPGDTWPGFEGWEEPIAIFPDSESDTPTHCHVCEALIPHALTGDGYGYVAEHVARFLAGTGARAEIIRAWWAQYGPDLDESDLRGLIDDALEQAADAKNE